MSAEPEDRLAEISDDVEEVSDTSIRDIPFELFEKQGNRTTKLVANSGNVSAIEGRKRWHDFQFREAILASLVRIETEGYHDFHEFEISWADESGREKEARGRPVNGIVEITINDICTKISFKPPSVFFGGTKILRVKIEGMIRENIAGALETLSDLETFKEQIQEIAERTAAQTRARVAEVQKAASDRDSILRDISQQKSAQARVKKNIGELSLTRDDLTAKNAAAQQSLENVQLRHKI